MALEDITAGNTIANLVLTNPADGDDASQGDDHIRNLKKALQYSFPNISATASGVAAEFAFAHKGGTVSGNAVILGSLSVSGAMSFASTLSVSGAMSLATTLSVSGAAVMKTTLNVEGATTLSGAAVMKGGVTLESSLTVSGAAVMKSGLHIDGNLSVSGSLIGSFLISQGNLKTTFGDVSVPIAGANITLPGGEYGFYPMVWADGGSTMTAQTAKAVGGSVANNNIYLEGGTGTNVYARQRYVQASPPYDLGDGEIPLFIFALMNADGSIHSTCVAPEAPWHNNGPTSIRPDLEIGGKKFQRRRAILAEFGSIRAAIQNSGLTRAQIMDRFATDQMIDWEITQAIKQADMPLLPHPFMGNNLTGKTVVLLDPVSPLMSRLLDLHDAGESVTEIVRDWLTIGNTALVRKGPPGVMVCAARLK